MKRRLIILAAFIILSGCSEAPETTSSTAPGVAVGVSQPSSVVESQSPALPTIEYPLLVTSLGQSTDGLLVREMLNDIKAEYTYQTVVPPEEIGRYRTVLLAVGASSKALGSLGLTAEAELERCKLLLKSIPDTTVVVLVRLGDSVSQDSLTSSLLDLALPCADMVLITQNSDREGKIAKDLAEYNIPFNVSDSVRQMSEAFSALLFPSTPEQ